MLITGAAGGIGSATSRAFAQAGRPVIAHDLAPREGFEESLAALSDEFGVETRAIYFDLTDPAAMKAAIQSLFKEKIYPTTLVNNAGIPHGALFQMTPISQVRKVFEVNLFAAMELTQLILKGMRRAGGGTIVNLSSNAGLDLLPGNSAYGVSKAAIAAWTKTLAAELGGNGIRVNAVAPGLTETAMSSYMQENAGRDMLESSAMGRLGNPDEIARVIVFLAGNDSSFINGQTIRIDGGGVMWVRNA